MSKVVLLAINAKYVHSSLAVWALAAGIRMYARYRHDASIVETTIKQNVTDITDAILAHDPDVIGISVYIWNAGLLQELLRRIRERSPDTIVVLGGPEASYNAFYWLEIGADYVIEGEGEQSFPALLDDLLEKQSAAEGLVQEETSVEEAAAEEAAVQEAAIGVLFNESRALKETVPVETAHMETSPMEAVRAFSSQQNPTQVSYPKQRIIPQPVPLRSADIVDPYSSAYFKALEGRIAYIETSRGCPFQCSFCLSGGSGVRFFSLERAKEQILRLSKSGTRTIKFVDRTFNCSAERAYELLKFILSLDTQCRFHFEVAPDLFDEQTLSLLASAPPGRLQLEAGLQSFNTAALEASSRKTDLEAAEKNIRAILSSANIHVHVDLIAGLPYETLHDFKDSFDRAYKLNAHTLQLGFLKLLHGSEIRKQAEHLGITYSKDPTYEIMSSPWLSEDDIVILKAAENALQNTRNKGRFMSTLKYVLSASDIRPFELFRMLGDAVPNHGMSLTNYAECLYGILSGLEGVNEVMLREHMICDWLSMVRGRNMPPSLQIHDMRNRQMLDIAGKELGRNLQRCEASVLPAGRGVYADSEDRDPVTGLYRLHYVAIS